MKKKEKKKKVEKGTRMRPRIYACPGDCMRNVTFTVGKCSTVARQRHINCSFPAARTHEFINSKAASLLREKSYKS